MSASPLEPVTVTYAVTAADTALAVGSGSLEVLGTPRLLAWLEAVTCRAVEPLLAEGQTSVGVDIRLEHLAASALGTDVACFAEVTSHEGRRVVLAVSARHTDDSVVARGEVTRVIVDAARFMERLG